MNNDHYKKLCAEICRGNIYSIEYELPLDLNQAELIVNGSRIYPASLPKSKKDYFRITNCDQVNQIIYQSGLPIIRNTDGIYLHALWPNYVGYIPLKSYRPTNNNITELCLNARILQKIERGHKFRLVNILAGTLDSLELGEYYYNATTKTIYFKSDEMPNEIYIHDQRLISCNLESSLDKLTLPKTIITGKNLTLTECEFKERNGEGIVLNGADNIIIHKCIFRNLSDSGVMILNSTNITITDCTFINCCMINYRHGVDVYIDNKSKNIKIERCIFSNSPKSGIQINSGNLIVDKCQFRDTSWFGHYAGAITINSEPATNELMDICIYDSYFQNIKTAAPLKVSGIVINHLCNIKYVHIKGNQFCEMDNTILIGKNVDCDKLKCASNLGWSLAEMSNPYVAKLTKAPIEKNISSEEKECNLYRDIMNP
jgi:hypothetical protein